MPFSGIDKQMYDKGYYAGYRRATIDHLGGRCKVCNTTKRLTIHHKRKLNRKQRNLKDLKNLAELEVLCEEHHDDIPRHRK